MLLRLKIQDLESRSRYDEAQLVKHLMDNDDIGFSYLYENYSNAVYTIIKTYIYDDESANDILQDVFVNIFRKIGTYDSSKSRLYTWIASITKNLCVDVVRSRDFRNGLQKVSLSEALELVDPKIRSSFDGIGLIKSFVKLRPKYWQVLELHYFQGYSKNEIAQILDIPLGTVKTRIRAAILQLRSMLE